MTRPAPDMLTTLAQCRAGIDAIDQELMTLLAERQAHVDAVMAIKARDGIAANTRARVTEVIDGAKRSAVQKGLDPALAETLWTAMVEHFIAKEEAVIGTGGAQA
ncbi:MULTISPECIES: chorismate mutase [Jannaschia]|nr:MULTISPECIES: chorismate mutase [unclassified Jannaschia]